MGLGCLWGQGGAAWDADRSEGSSLSPRARLFTPTLPAWQSGSGATWDSQNCSPKEGELKGRGKGHLKHSQLLYLHAQIFSTSGKINYP